MAIIKDCVALVTGSNRGIGKAFCEHLLQAGAAKVYAAARDPAAVIAQDSRIVPIRLDITRPADVEAAARTCGDVTVLINNAGVLASSPMIGPGAEAAARFEMETNYFGTLSMVQRFAPILASNGGGAIINMLSTSSWITNPFLATYSASKMAATALTDAVRLQLRAQGTRVVGVYAGFVDTDMAAHVDAAKTSPQQVVARALAGLEAGVMRVLADDRSVEVDARLRADRGAFDAELQQRWDAAHAADE